MLRRALCLPFIAAWLLVQPAAARTAPLPDVIAASPALPSNADIDARIERIRTETGAQGLALAVIDDGRVVHVVAKGIRNAAADPLTPDTIMYGASLTKTVYAFTVMQLVDAGLVDLDQSISAQLDRPLTELYSEDLANRYADWRALDPRWRDLTHRRSLTHSTGFANFGFMEPDGKAHIHFDPGTRYAYSGDGFILSQFVLEQGKAGLDVGAEVQHRVFDRFGMSNSSLIWRPDFAANLADGWDENGVTEPHDERSKVRVAGSMDTTITDMSRLAAGFIRGEGLSAESRAEMLRPQLPIATATQFGRTDLPPEQRRPDLSAGLGLITFTGPQGPGFFKGGHNDTTANTWICLEASRRCVVILSNDVRAEKAFPALVRFILGDTGVPYDWEYGPETPGL